MNYTVIDGYRINSTFTAHPVMVETHLKSGGCQPWHEYIRCTEHDLTDYKIRLVDLDPTDHPFWTHCHMLLGIYVHFTDEAQSYATVGFRDLRNS